MRYLLKIFSCPIKQKDANIEMKFKKKSYEGNNETPNGRSASDCNNKGQLFLHLLPMLRLLHCAAEMTVREITMTVEKSKREKMPLK